MRAVPAKSLAMLHGRRNARLRCHFSSGVVGRTATGIDPLFLPGDVNALARPGRGEATAGWASREQAACATLLPRSFPRSTRLAD
jgi:hypothetical protein